MTRCFLRVALALACITLAIETSSAQQPGTITCQPGIGGVSSCPCTNPPSGPGRGCDNSMSTGGAALNASGFPSLSSDTVRFIATFIGTNGPTCSSPTGNVLSVLYQGNSFNPTGITWGDGVLCCGGNVLLMNSSTSSGGIYIFPQSVPPTVSALSASLGDVLSPGSTRCYFVAYRDSCPSFCTPSFRQTTSGYSITWVP